jgi:hypothetical protein
MLRAVCFTVLKTKDEDRVLRAVFFAAQLVVVVTTLNHKV